MEVLAVVACAVGGLLLAGFMNLLIDRVPDRHPLRAANLPTDPCSPVSLAVVRAQPYLLRIGRCPSGGRLPRRYLAVEVVTAATFALAATRYRSSALLPILLFAAALIVTSTIDLQVQRIPDRIVFPALALSLPMVVFVSYHLQASGAIKGALIGMVAYFLLLFPLNLINPGWMGFGDVKLALLMGLYLGWVGWDPRFPVLGPIRMVFYGAMIGMFAGAIGGLLLTGFKMRRHFPLGPFIAAGSLVVVLFATSFRYGG